MCLVLFVNQCCVSYQFCNHLAEEERTGCFTLIASWCLVTVNVLWFSLAMPWVGLQCVILVFPGHTQITCFFAALSL